MNKNPKVSIVTVVFNGQSTIRKTVESVFSQHYGNIEYILIDGGSKDWTLDILENYKDRISYFVSEEDDGIYDAMNKGIRAATGDVIGILNSDDFYPNKNIISDVVDVFNADNCDSLYGDLVYVKLSNAEKVVRYWKTGIFSILKLKRGWMLPHPTFFVKKSIYEKYGLYNTQLKSAADYEMILRLLHKHAITVSYLPNILVKMRIGGISNANLINRMKANREDGRAWQLNNLEEPMFVRLFKPLQKVRQFFLKPKI